MVPGCVVTDELLRVVEEESRSPIKGSRKRLERAAKMVAMFKGMGFNGVHIGGLPLKRKISVLFINRAAELESCWKDLIPKYRSVVRANIMPSPRQPTTSFLIRIRMLSKGLEKGVYLGYELSKLFHRIVFERSAWSREY